MFGGASDGKELARYATIAQVGLEMAVPPGIGAYVDRSFGTGPWGVIVGAVLGLTGGLVHLVMLVNKEEHLAAQQKASRQLPPDGPNDKESRSP